MHQQRRCITVMLQVLQPPQWSEGMHLRGQVSNRVLLALLEIDNLLTQ
jgi:hypothetical protein